MTDAHLRARAMSKPKRIPLLEKIARLRAKHLGYEDIAVELGVDWRHIRPFVITKKASKCDR